MERQSKATSSLGTAKRNGFGLTLKDAISEEFGSSKAFAIAMGVSPGRISQLVQGPEDINPQTLGKVLSAFKTWSLQEQIHEAWIQEFAPLPLAHLDSRAILQQIANIGDKLSPQRALKLALSARKQELDPELWQLLTERIVHLNQRLMRTASALRVLKGMENRAKVNKEQVHASTALWMRCNVLRGIPIVSWKQLNFCHEKAVSFADATKPSGGDALSRWQEKRFQMDRDFALNLLSGVERGELPSPALETAHVALTRSQQFANDPSFYFYALEVRSRLEFEQGNTIGAEETIEEIEANGMKYCAEFPTRIGFTRAKLHIRRGKSEQAELELRKIARTCHEDSNLYHAAKADRELIRLLIA